MKLRVFNTKGRLLLLAGLIIIALSLDATAQSRKNYHVDFEVENNNGNDELVLKTAPGRHCTHPGAQKGCVGVKKNHSGDIHFRLQGNTQCSRGQKWQLDEVQLAGEDAPDKPRPAVWTTQKVDLSKRVVEDFNAEPVSGLAGFGRNPNGDIWIHSKNRTMLPQGAPGTEAYHIWYRVRATCGGDVATAIYSDPTIRNYGNR